ncbi:MAG: TerB family tellurite resistance protein [Pseudomonadota bacterium]
MLKAWLTQLGEALAPSSNAEDVSADREHVLRVATAALLVEVARADHSFDPAEQAAMLSLVAQRFGLSADETRALTDEAAEAAGDAVSVYEFAQQLHETLSVDDKSEVVNLLWQVAYADGRLDKYENSLVLKISDLMYVPRGQVMRLKHDAAVAAGAVPAEQKLDDAAS